MTGPIVIIPGIAGNITPDIQDGTLFISLQGNPAGTFTCTVPTPAEGAFYVINNATEQIALIAGPGGNPAQARPRSDMAVWVDGLGNGHNFL